MLKEIRCDRFRTKRLEFHPGLNVMLGDEKATNSIGKSMALMVVDFVFGGNSFLSHNVDAIKELGHHAYEFQLLFKGTPHFFRRETGTPKIVIECNSQYEPKREISVGEYTRFLRDMYAFDRELSFRELVGPYSRIWGKENLNVKRPFHSFPKQSNSAAVDTLIELFGSFGPIRDLSKDLASAKESKQVLDGAFRHNYLKRISEAQYRRNKEELKRIDAAVDKIRSDISLYALNLNQLLDDRLLEKKREKDALVTERTRTIAELERVRSNLEGTTPGNQRSLKKLVELLPGLNQERLRDLAKFHSGISSILREQLELSEKSLVEMLSELDKLIANIDTHIAEFLASADSPASIVDRIAEIAQKRKAIGDENEYFLEDENIKKELDSLRRELADTKRSVTDDIASKLNSELRTLTSFIYSKTRRSPEVAFSDSDYRFDVFEDTGTGKAYANLLMLDLAMLLLTPLPFVIHDSLLFKNVENDAVSRIIERYCTFDRQSFIAIDEVGKYSDKARGLISEGKVIELNANSLLYDKDWRVL